MPRMTKAEKSAAESKKAARIAIVCKAVHDNSCPDCGAGVHTNLALTGWVQCDRSGDGHFRRDKTGAKCLWQGFTV